MASCQSTDENKEQSVVPPFPETPQLTIEKAQYLYHFAFHCIDQEYPNKLNQVIGDSTYLKTPKTLHPAFYGCFDWHSSVHGHWTLIHLMSRFTDLPQRDSILLKLSNNINPKNIEQELHYFDDQYNKNYERTYGWAWLLKLAVVLDQWNTPEANKMQKDLQPLVDLMEQKFVEFLPKLNYPIRIGEHYNTAYGMSFALDYAIHFKKEAFQQLLTERAKTYYFNDQSCPLTWEPGGFDFLSPCLQEANLMLKVLPQKEYLTWLHQFLPDFTQHPEQYIQPAVVSDRTDGKIVHLDGLNFSRASNLYSIGKALKNPKIIALANEHFNASYDKMDSGEYAGEHWLASFALHALLEAEK